MVECCPDRPILAQAHLRKRVDDEWRIAQRPRPRIDAGTTVVWRDLHGELKRSFDRLVLEYPGDDTPDSFITRLEPEIRDERQFVEGLARALVACGDRPGPTRKVLEKCHHSTVCDHRLAGRACGGIFRGLPKKVQPRSILDERLPVE
jgi:hypothetical protein